MYMIRKHVQVYIIASTHPHHFYASCSRIIFFSSTQRIHSFPQFLSLYSTGLLANKLIVFFSNTKSTSVIFKSAVFFSYNKLAPVTSHSQPNIASLLHFLLFLRILNPTLLHYFLILDILFSTVSQYPTAYL